MKSYKLSAVFHRKVLTEDLRSTDREGVLRELLELIVEADGLERKNLEPLLRLLLDREKIGSTGIGGGVAIPHIKTELVQDVTGAVGRSEAGIDYNTIDGEKAHIFFLFLSPKEQNEVHLDVLKKISALVRNKLYIQFLRNARKKNDILDVLKEAESGGGSA
jgi:PTS system fructose-specific IIA component/PTS system nitrogen regulatory IIA component